MRFWIVTGGFSALLTLGLAADHRMVAGASSQADQEGTCAVSEVSRSPLLVEGGRRLYVEPVAFVGGERQLLAGWPTYLYQPRTGEKTVRVPADSLFGAVIDPDGTARTIPVPFRSRQLGSIKALPRDDGNWDVVFAQVASYPDSSLFPPDSADRVWYGVLSSTGWVTLDTIPIRALTGRSFGTGHSSRLVRRGDTLHWAFVANREILRSDVVLLSRHAGRWTSRSMAAHRTGYLDMIHSERKGLVFAAVTPDSTEMQDSNSLFLFSWNEGFGRARRLYLGARANAYQPAFSHRGNKIDILWPSRPDRARHHQAWALADVLREPRDSVLVVDDDLASPFPPQAVQGETGALWITHHATSDQRSESVLRFSHLRDGQVARLAEFTTPYLGGFRAAGIPGGVMTTGTQADTVAGGVWSLLVRYRTTACDSR